MDDSSCLVTVIEIWVTFMLTVTIIEIWVTQLATVIEIWVTYTCLIMNAYICV
jgi:uncharacterized membrane protein